MQVGKTTGPGIALCFRTRYCLDRLYQIKAYLSSIPVMFVHAFSSACRFANQNDPAKASYRGKITVLRMKSIDFWCHIW